MNNKGYILLSTLFLSGACAHQPAVSLPQMVVSDDNVVLTSSSACEVPKVDKAKGDEDKSCLDE